MARHATKNRPQPKKAPKHIMEHLLETFAFHISCIHKDMMHGGAGLSFEHPAGNIRQITCEIHIEPSHMREKGETWSVWDQVTIDGVHCGNRCGGAAEYARRMAPLFMEAAKLEGQPELTASEPTSHKKTW